MFNIRNIANRTMTSTDETISNLIDQMSEAGIKTKKNLSDTGTKLKKIKIQEPQYSMTWKRKKKGGPLTAPKSDEIIELDPEINEGVSTIQASIKRRKTN